MFMTALSARGGWLGLGRFVFVDMGIVERISLRYFPGKYRVGGGASLKSRDDFDFDFVFFRGGLR